MPTLRGSGVVASVGYASGPLFRLDQVAMGYQPSGEAATEVARLRDTIAASASAVRALIVEADEDSAAILEFQVAMFEDDALAEPAFDAIDDGVDAATAWTAALDEQIIGYDAANDAYFRARSADLADIRDRVLRGLSGLVDARAPDGAVLFARELTPTQFLTVDWGQGGGIVLTEGSAASHVAMLARARGVPMLIGVRGLAPADGDFVLLDAKHGQVIVQPDPEARRDFLKASSLHSQLVQLARSRMGEKAVTSNGQPIDVLVNIAEPAEVETFDIAHCDGVGLMRTEFLFGDGLPDEETQYRAYRRVLEWANGKPVTIRTVDAGGDKPVPGFTVDEGNPFLGLRGLRLSLTRTDVFRAQIRALLRAAPHGALKVMFPMVSIIGEYRAAVTLFAEEGAALLAAGIAHAMPPLGIMVEVPAVAIHPQTFAEVAFFSIGSNDLTQYVMAAGRDNGAVAALNDTRNPAVLSLIRNVVAFADENAIPISLCGDAGSDPAIIPALLRAALRSLSVAPAQLPLAKAAISRISTTDGRDGQD